MAYPTLLVRHAIIHALTPMILISPKTGNHPKPGGCLTFDVQAPPKPYMVSLPYDDKMAMEEVMGKYRGIRCQSTLLQLKVECRPTFA